MNDNNGGQGDCWQNAGGFGGGGGGFGSPNQKRGMHHQNRGGGMMGGMGGRNMDMKGNKSPMGPFGGSPNYQQSPRGPYDSPGPMSDDEYGPPPDLHRYKNDMLYLHYKQTMIFLLKFYSFLFVLLCPLVY